MSLTRRQFLHQAGGGLGGLALTTMLATADQKLRPDGGLHHKPRAKRIVQLFMAGGASHLDLFDYKPELVKRHGQNADFGEKVEAFQNGLGPWLKPVWKFQPHGQSGRMLSEVVSPLGAVADELAFVHNLVGKTGVHSQGTLLQTTGFNRPGFPGMGSWVSYGLGSLNDNLPTFVVLPDHRGLASNGTKNWDAAFLSGQHAGTMIFPGKPLPIDDLFPDPKLATISPQSEAAAQSLLAQFNRQHADSRAGDERLDARIRSYELAARMQLAAPEALDLSKEPAHVLKLYGLDHGKSSFDREINALEETDIFARKCLVARRMLERGVRFIQIWSGNDNGFPRRNWDSHEDIQRDHGPLAFGMAKGAAALIADLKRLGLLEDTIVFWTTEFGRMPSSQSGKGRDHNPYVFTNWFAGGGIRPGATVGHSDEFGYKPADRKHPTEVYDIHATLLHLLGIDHTRLTVRHNGIDRRLTDVHGHLLPGLMA
ncbi:DUF1501 domain-containing protein [Tuwongella immobilis]|uniref:Sulfatase n=1 Tax=Tuwongella immobilis TaxID=692036 RepID=A0A6C2YN08_9BACT|nr:DUF1501 domain-containing protein [Tuwongella immobilis]VIP02826.1 protein containing duf1501 : Uncharacterized protein OS=Chthoniobacter flavus Ellin428 GN=CfE428DRAFT_3523 PE=4 SV=1: DUF1501 [Tuwongella immobilis]VTS02566.1 protein containing duf1501 : Uncharacterized protein OS=Chthoniobacter flavus Ellin428 GN=CfE428DRAFT_3523 PE=4 SV=1: DUF1501 [Tuwongella immobilis]